MGSGVWTMIEQPHRPTVRGTTGRNDTAVFLVCSCGWSQMWRRFDPTPTELLEAEISHRRQQP